MVAVVTAVCVQPAICSGQHPVTAEVVSSLGTPSYFRPPEPTRWGPTRGSPGSSAAQLHSGGCVQVPWEWHGAGAGPSVVPARYWARDLSVAHGQVGGHS